MTPRTFRGFAAGQIAPRMRPSRRHPDPACDPAPLAETRLRPHRLSGLARLVRCRPAPPGKRPMPAGHDPAAAGG
ncbi:hypothetical protein RNZ50_00555 [Paracoccaceae bacterium Fryx2]|nr:hypothetical protein [Paracoccaceae bacterium Fryx2]